MQILLDDVPCDVPAATVGEAIAAAAELAGRQGRLIVDVTVDGTRWTEEDPAAEGRAASVVALRSADPPELVRQAFADAEEALADAGTLQKEAAELLQSDRVVAAMDKLGGAMSIWLCVREAIVKGAALAELDLAAALPGGLGLDEAVQLLQDKLEGLRAALREADHVAVSDALLYEFPEVVARWRGLLQDLQKQVR